MKIVCLDGGTLNPGDNPWDAVAALGEFVLYEKTLPSQILERAAGAEVILTNKTPLTAETLKQLPALKFISVLATGFNVVDVAAAKELGISVSNIPVYGTDSVAQFVFAMTLEMCHNVKHHSDAVKVGKWQEADNFCFWDFPLTELSGLTMGLIGFGRIGKRTGEIAKAFGMKVIAADEYQGNPADYDFEWKSVEEVFAEADIVSMHCPQTEASTEMVNADMLNLMKPSAFFVNTSRGGLVQEQDLADALNAGKLAGAACDVVSTEPISNDNPLLKAKNCIITPHIAWATLSARKRLMATTAENIDAYQSNTPINVVN